MAGQWEHGGSAGCRKVRRAASTVSPRRDPLQTFLRRSPQNCRVTPTDPVGPCTAGRAPQGGLLLYFLLSLLMAVAVGAAKGAVDEAQLLQGLRSRDEAAFASLVRAYHGPLVRLARQYVASEAAAEEVAQDTWMALVNGIDRFPSQSWLSAQSAWPRRRPTAGGGLAELCSSARWRPRCGWCGATTERGGWAKSAVAQSGAILRA